MISVLVDEIISGRYPSGSLLPPEPELCRSFDVSRSVVREAMKALEEKGLARARQGRGTTITSPNEWNLLDPIVLEATIRADDTMEVLDELVDVRAALESDMARAAARLMSDADLAELKVLLVELHGQVHDAARYQETDTRYHDVIMRCSGNRSVAPSSARSTPTRGRAPGTPLGPTNGTSCRPTRAMSRSTSSCSSETRMASPRRCRSTSEAPDAPKGQTRLIIEVARPRRRCRRG